jgi:uncharacterized protein
MTAEPRIPINRDQIKAFCEKWQIVEFSLFGSVLTDEFRPDSDVDVMVEFSNDAPWTLLDMVDMEQELQTLFQRKVDLITHSSVTACENYLMRNSILSGARMLYAA